jgi:inorganic pyrophosphatase
MLTRIIQKTRSFKEKGRSRDDLGKPFERELEEFFVNYHRLSGKQYRILALKGPAAGRRCVERARKRAR